MEDETWMRRALELAERGAGRVSPNPLVGAVVVKNGKVVAEGFHARFGGPHAEAAALARAGKRARGATLYVTLEPCAHHGKTPPCADAVRAAGVRRVVVAARDPNPEVAGRGIALLSAAGIRVEEGILAREAERQNAPYRRWRAAGVPFVTLKWAETEDGKIAGPRGRRIMISGVAARRSSHALRAQVDAILVGVGTALSDDPVLTARLVEAARQPVRIVLDSRARLPLASRLVRTARKVPLWVVATPRASPARLARLSRAGCEVIVLPAVEGGVSLEAFLALAGRRQIQHLLVEGGASILRAFAGAGFADRVVCWISHRTIGKGLAAPLPPPGSGGAAPFRYGRILMRHEPPDIRVEAEIVHPAVRKA